MLKCKNNHAITTLLCIISIISVFSCKSAEEESEKSDIALYLPATIKIGKGMDGYTQDQAETGLSLAFALSQKALIYPQSMIDSVISSKGDDISEMDALKLAREVGTDNILFANISRIEQMLRVSLVSLPLKEIAEGEGLREALAKGKQAEGFAYINLWRDDKPVIDPALVKASQRALADLMQDSLLYSGKEKAYEVFPWPNIAIGGFDIVDSTGLELPNKIFKDKTLSGFAASEVAFEELAENGPFVTWDIASRDTVMTLERFYGVENDRISNPAEQKTLWKAGVDQILLGSIKRTETGGIVTVYIGHLSSNGFKRYNSSVAIFEGETIKDLIPAVRKAVSEILEKIKE
ncbi:MAG: hypothetical protein Kapaf2KO_17740 [Candidatus Kapaibacteriales bacterium]